MLTLVLQLASWIMMLASFPLAFLVIRTVKQTNYDQEEVVYVDDVKREVMEHGVHDAESGSIEKDPAGIVADEVNKS